MGIPTSEDKGLAFIICPLVLIILSVALTAFYYHQFHPGGTFKTNGPKRCTEDNNTGALFECNTLFCCHVWNCKFIFKQCQTCKCMKKGYIKMKRSESSVVTFHVSNGHIETALETVNLNGVNDEIISFHTSNDVTNLPMATKCVNGELDNE